MKFKFLWLLPVILLISAALLGCSSNEMTKVTVYFAKDGQASLEQKRLPLIDRFLNLFGSEAYAQIHQTSDTAFYFLYVTADDLEDSYYVQASGTDTSVSLDVPSGENRVFTLFSFSPDGNYNYIGQESEDLTGGEASISINMYPCLNDISVSYAEDVMDITWTYDTTLEGNYSSVKIYRSCYGTDTTNCDGSIDTVATGQEIGSAGSGSASDSSLTFASGNVYYYLRRFRNNGGKERVEVNNDYYERDNRRIL